MYQQAINGPSLVVWSDKWMYPHTNSNQSATGSIVFTACIIVHEAVVWSDLLFCKLPYQHTTTPCYTLHIKPLFRLKNTIYMYVDFKNTLLKIKRTGIKPNQSVFFLSQFTETISFPTNYDMNKLNIDRPFNHFTSVSQF